MSIEIHLRSLFHRKKVHTRKLFKNIQDGVTVHSLSLLYIYILRFTGISNTFEDFLWTGKILTMFNFDLLE
jgi:hypothetical protein